MSNDQVFTDEPASLSLSTQDAIRTTTTWSTLKGDINPNVNIVNFVDATAHVILPWISNASKRNNFELKGLIGVNVSEHQDKFPVTSFGRTRNKGYTQGNAVVGGSLIFNSFHNSAFTDIVNAYTAYRGVSSLARLYTIKDIPPFDMDITFVSDESPYSNDGISYMKLRGISVVDYSMSMSIDNFKMIESVAFMATYFVPLQSELPSTKVEVPQVQKASSGSKILKKTAAPT